jgi:hypothetical protein
LTPEINNILTLIECTLLEQEKPDYIEVSWQNDIIYVLLSKEEYRHIKVYERIQSVYALIQFEYSELLEEYSVLVECLDSDELKGLFELYGKK